MLAAAFASAIKSGCGGWTTEQGYHWIDLMPLADLVFRFIVIMPRLPGPVLWTFHSPLGAGVIRVTVQPGSVLTVGQYPVDLPGD